MTPEQYQSLASQNFNRIPVLRRVLADLETPVTSYLKLASGPYSYLFESVHGGEKWGRYSIIGLPCRRVIKIFGHTVRIEAAGQLLDSFTVADPLAYIEEYQKQFRVPHLQELPEDLAYVVPKFHGGLVGYFAYDTVRYVEKKLADSAPVDELGNADVLLMESDEVVVFDNLEGSLNFIVHADPADPDAYEKAQQRLDELVAMLANKTPDLAAIHIEGSDGSHLSETEFQSRFSEDAFKTAVETIKEYILSGDVMQVVLSQRLSIPFDAEPINLYRALRSLNPSPYMYFLNLGDTHIVGSSPEILARLEDNIVSVRPIAGTRRRGHSEAEDLALEQEMLSDPKEIAEHLMLIDLGRNDVGRVAEIGSVHLTEKMNVERYSHVMHIVSSVDGTLLPGKSALDVLRATLPAGTLSGAPKIRAMEIIDELEPVKRGIYGGAVGYLSWTGNMDTAIAIRTAVLKDGVLNIQAGAGVVADSQAALEWKETMNKARAVFRAASMATPPKHA